MRCIARLASSAVFLFAFGCDCSGPEPGGCDTAEDCATSEVCRDGTCVARPDGGGEMMDGGGNTTRDGGPPRDAGGPECAADDDCAGDGVCLDGACCPSAEQVCGAACCTGAETCFANACVTPGALCRSSEDCGDGQYCEPSLGESGGSPDAGMPDAGGAVCLGAAPATGRCVDLPPRCEGEPMPGEVCIRDCEFRPPVGRLNAVPQWTWGASNAVEYPGIVDVWATPAVGRLSDTNCDGVVDEFDPPNIVFVSGDARGTCCSCGAANTLTCKTGVLRVLDGQSGRELWSLRGPDASSMGWSGLSVALGDLDHDGDMEIAAVSGEGFLVIVDHEGNVVSTSDVAIPGWLGNRTNGWGGGLTIADMDRDGDPEIAYGRAVFTTDGATTTLRWVGTGSWGRAITQAISVFVDLDADPDLELLSGDTVYDTDGSIIWNSPLGEGFSAVANFDADPEPEIAYVVAGVIHLLSAADGTDEVTPVPAPGTMPGSGGPLTIADFDGDGLPEIGVAYQDFYQVVQINDAGDALEQVWATPSHDFSSSVTGSTVFDFEGDGAAEVVYNDECFLWVYDGRTGAVRFAAPTTSFTATEASLVADVDSDGSAEIVMVSNRADPSVATGWHCDGLYRATDWTQPAAPGAPDEGRPGWVGSDGVGAGGAPYSGVTVFRASDNSWVGTRSLWNQHAYHVSNICGDRGDACDPPSTYGDIPRQQVANHTVGFLNNFRQNIQGEGIFDAPDATVSLDVICTTPVKMRASVRNLGAAVLTDGVEVGFYLVEAGGAERELGRATTSTALFPGQVEVLELDGPADVMGMGSVFRARILVDPAARTFTECREDNNESEDVEPRCLM